MRDRLSASALMPVVGAFLLLLLAVAPAQAQNGVITGTVTSEQGQPLAGAQITLTQTGYGAQTNAEGVYRIPDVRPGTYNVEVQYIGYATEREANVVLDDGELVTQDFQLSTQALQLQQIRVTGVADPIEGVRMPFSISRVEMEDITVPAHQDMASVIRGRVAGARVVSSSGMPGSGVDIRLRARHGVNTSDSPLIVVDGVIQAQNTVDLDALDIESLEVLKGAAAASLYGSRAQAGVIEIQTRRGREVGAGQTRITLRSEVGQSFLGDVPPTASHHPYLMDENGEFIDEDGNIVARVDRVLAEDRMVDNPYTGQLYNHLELFFDPGRFANNSVNIAQNTNSTNFFASFADSRETGVAPDFNEGYHRQNLRFNIDHRMRSDLTVGFSIYHSKSSQQNLSGGNPFYDLRFIAPDIDLTQPNLDTEGNPTQPYLIRPDSTANQNSPLYDLWVTDSWDYRQRTQGSFNVRFNPFSWLNLDALMAYDRSDRESHFVEPADLLTTDPAVTAEGEVSREHDYDEAINGHLQATLIRSFGELTARTRLRWNFEREEESGFDAEGQGYIVRNVPTIDNMLETEGGGAEFDFIRTEGFMLNTGLDFQNKYIGDFLIRREGSSLFGPDNRWHTYYRASLSYLMSEEEWWPFESLTAFKPSFSIGTAGARPGFDWRYETWSVGSAGPSKGTLGNRNLAPEVSTEQDFGLDLIINDRYSVELTYAKSTVDDQLIPIPLPSFFGYGSQWQNGGQVKTEAYEATFEAALVQNQNMSWNMGLVLDRAKAWLSEWESTCYRTSNFYRCQGESFSTMRRRTWMTSLDDLPDFHSGSLDQFQVNDEGYLVPVGDADYTDGLNSDGTVNRWGTFVDIDGVEYAWGEPIYIVNEDGSVDDLHEAGDANPLFNLGWTNRIRWRGFTFSSLLDAKIGGDIYNGTAQWPYRDDMSMDQVQAGKPLELKKPLDYYQELYSTNAANSHFIEDGTYVKIREIQVGYRLSSETLNSFLPANGLGMQSMALNLIGRNLFTFTDYTGIDPEVGGGGAGGPTENPDDSFDYPNFRQFTFSVEVQF